MTYRVLKGCCAVLGMLLLLSCGGPEEKKMKFYTKGKALYEKGEMVKAGLEFKNALQIDPKFADAYTMMGMVKLKQGDLQGAFGSFTKATELDPNQLNAQAQLGRLFLAGGAPDKAMEKAELVLKKEPKNEEALLVKGAVFLARKEFDAARSHLEGLIGAGIRKPDVYILLASVYNQKNDSGRSGKSPPHGDRGESRVGDPVPGPCRVLRQDRPER